MCFLFQDMATSPETKKVKKDTIERSRNKMSAPKKSENRMKAISCGRF